ncbi:MAG: F0F1 ATP synthase subunit B [Frankiaceae bacterium]|jgi:F-type H+-transporting ATPase subunit b
MHDMAVENFLLPNGTLVVEFVIFLVVLIVLWRAVLPPLLRAMNERQELIRQQIAEGQAAAEAAERAEREYREALAETRAEASRIREEARAQGQRMQTELKEKAAAEYAAMSADNEARLAAEREQILAALQPEIRSMAAELGGRMLGEPLSGASLPGAEGDRAAVGPAPTAERETR